MSWLLDLGIVIPAFVVGAAAQWWIRHVVAEANDIPSSANVSGRIAAGRLLAAAGIAGVSVGPSEDGELSDHYDGRTWAIRLADPDATSVAAVAVAAHEVGHATQDRDGTAAFRMRAAMAPVAAVASIGWLVLVFFGFILGLAGLLHLAVLMFGAVALFHLVTLPVELQASRRALVLVRSDGLVTEAEVRIVRRVLRAAALTCVAAALVSIAQIVQFLFMGEE